MLYIRMTIACAVFTLFCGIVYFKNKKLPLVSTKLFISLLFTTLVFFLFDGIAFYSVNHLKTLDGLLVSTPWNDTAHIIRLLLINIFAYLFSNYVSYFTDIKRKRSKVWFIIDLCILLISSILIIVLPISYRSLETNYAIGPKYYTLYASFSCFMVLIIYKVIRHWENMSQKKFFIISSILILISMGIVQIAAPRVSFTSIGIGLIILSIVLCSENAEKYFDNRILFFNFSVLELVLNDWLKYKKNFTILTISLEQYISYYKIKHQEAYILKDISNIVNQRHKEFCYSIEKSSFSILLTNSSKVESVLTSIKLVLNRYCNDGELKLDYNVLEAKEGNYNSSREIENKINSFLTKLDDNNISIDALSKARNRNAFEREFILFNDHSKNKWLILFDLNNFKEINDTYGHALGDVVIEQFAQTLRFCFMKSNWLYRVGGDEFVILYTGEEEELKGILEYALNECQSIKDLPCKLTFAYGYAPLTEENPYEVADKHMYENKLNNR